MESDGTPKNVQIVRLPLANNQSTVIHLNWNSSLPQIECTLLANEHIWSGTIAFTKLRQTAITLEIPFGEFLGETKLALGTPNGHADFLYQIDHDQKVFVWKKSKGSFRILYGTMDLVECPNHDIVRNDVLQNAVDLIASINREVTVVNDANRKLASDLAKIVTVYEDCVVKKELVENELLSKFVQLLNAKKDRIAELEEQLNERQSSNSSPLRRGMRTFSDSDSMATDGEYSSPDLQTSIVEQTSGHSIVNDGDSIPKDQRPSTSAAATPAAVTSDSQEMLSDYDKATQLLDKIG